MKIPRPRKVERPFQRAKAPPTQATKLLLSSMSAGVILVVVLAIVFIPRALQEEANPPIPQVTLEVSGGGEMAWVNVTKVTVAAPLGDYNATVVRDSGTSAARVGVLPALSNGAADGGVRFHDIDADGVLSVRDSFSVAIMSGGTYTLLVHYPLLGELVGFARWTG